MPPLFLVTSSAPLQQHTTSIRYTSAHTLLKIDKRHIHPKTSMPLSLPPPHYEAAQSCLLSLATDNLKQCAVSQGIEQLLSHSVPQAMTFKDLTLEAISKQPMYSIFFESALQVYYRQRRNEPLSSKERVDVTRNINFVLHDGTMLQQMTSVTIYFLMADMEQSFVCDFFMDKGKTVHSLQLCLAGEI